MMHDSPNGVNINEHCGSTHMEDLIDYVNGHEVDLGLAFDGDSDRCLAVDENGKLIDGDRMIAIFALDMKNKGILNDDMAVVTVMTNLGFKRFAEANEINVAETLKDVRKALLDADVNYKVAKNFTDTMKEKALGQNVLTAVKPSQLMVKIVHDELTQLMGGETVEVDIDARPAVILMSGLQGSGKTTFSGKLARMLKTKKNLSLIHI